MTATNHVLTGAIIAAAIDKPLLALPLAFAAHFLMDMVPHFGLAVHTDRKFFVVLMLDCTLAAACLLAMIALQLPHWPLLVACGITCASPDLMWIRYLLVELRGHQAVLGPIARLHARIQLSETVPGLAVEIVWFIGAITLLGHLTI